MHVTVMCGLLHAGLTIRDIAGLSVIKADKRKAGK